MKPLNRSVRRRNTMSRRTNITVLVVLSGTLLMFFVPFDAAPFLELSLFELATGALAGGHWSAARVTLSLLFAANVVGLLGLIARLTWRMRSGHQRAPVNSANTKQLYIDREASFSVSLEPSTGRYYLDVLCGGIGMFERRLPLTPEEVESFKRDPNEIRTLALQVRTWPERFEARLGGRETVPTESSTGAV